MKNDGIFTPKTSQYFTDVHLPSVICITGKPAMINSAFQSWSALHKESNSFICVQTESLHAICNVHYYMVRVLLAAKVNLILCSDWLPDKPERARWIYQARSGFPALVLEEKSSDKMAGYWAWFFACDLTSTLSSSKNRIKELGRYPATLTWQNAYACMILLYLFTRGKYLLKSMFPSSFL